MQNKPVETISKYPDKPITIIVPYSVGGSTDLTARELEKTATKHLGQPLVVVNKPGGAGTIGWNELAGASPDGYTLGIVANEIVLHPLYSQTKYHYPTALEPVVQISSVSSVLAVQAKQPWQTLDDLVAYAKEHPGQLKFAHGGTGSINHVVGEMFGKTAGITIEQVPFRGGGEITAALLGGHVQIAVVGPAAIKEHVKSGTVRILAVSGEQRLNDPVLGNVPTFKEQGLDVVCTYWIGVGAPKGLPAEVKAKLAAGFKEIITSPEFKTNQEKLGLQLDYLDQQAAAAKWLEEGQKFAKVVQETGIADLIKAQKK
ncbi:ABC transporter substrate-binding protein [Anaerosporomusa subterranea]|uniref:ABC transporter substrate-binding protein n=1 Tax=Anaerosporomusa subterranea TaxID=1794912 RepID=A0A154BNR4_ANASB|nr:tripartite tricarboxylate transporter substrate binding protein [Anaerosporomusa subterranea]KYZ75614.1 ABC transporter substrate-binding protein [Anaerosporomusa subterranea]